jgi:hypothetical protein
LAQTRTELTIAKDDATRLREDNFDLASKLQEQSLTAHALRAANHALTTKVADAKVETDGEIERLQKEVATLKLTVAVLQKRLQDAPSDDGEESGSGTDSEGELSP